MTRQKKAPRTLGCRFEPASHRAATPPNLRGEVPNCLRAQPAEVPHYQRRYAARRLFGFCHEHLAAELPCGPGGGAGGVLVGEEPEHRAAGAGHGRAERAVI